MIAEREQAAPASVRLCVQLLVLVDGILSLNDADADADADADGGCRGRPADRRVALASRSSVAKLLASIGKAEAQLRDRKFPQAIDTLSSLVQSVMKPQ
jgi:hypothetical protein